MTDGARLAIALPSDGQDDEILSVYRSLLESWNSNDVDAYAALFSPDGTMIGFDGSTVVGQGEIKSHLSAIFADHQPARYVAKVRDVTRVSAEVAWLRADVGMVPPEATDIEPATNAIQTLVAIRRDGELQVALFQNTPAAFHGRADDSRRLTEELSQVLRDAGSIKRD